jgi:hypothetical protein
MGIRKSEQLMAAMAHNALMCAIFIAFMQQHFF